MLLAINSKKFSFFFFFFFFFVKFKNQVFNINIWMNKYSVVTQSEIKANLYCSFLASFFLTYWQDIIFLTL